MREIYIDETGTSEEEKIIGYGGIIVDAKQRKLLEDYHREICQEFFPDGLPKNFAFHADGIYNGRGIFSEEAGFSRQNRIDLLAR